MAFTSTIKPYKFVNPSSISSGGGATLIVGGKKLTGGATPQVKSARVTVLALNRIGMAMEGLGRTQQQIRDIIVTENKYLAKTTSFRKKKEGYKRDQKSEQQSESFGQKTQDQVKKEVVKKEKKQLGWLEKIFGPFAGIISFVTKVVITQTVLRWIGDPKNTDKLVVFVQSFTKVFKWAFNIAYKSTSAVLTGFSKVFGSSDKKGLDRFGEVLNGLGSLLIGIAGFKALGYLLNPFSLVNDIIGFVDKLSSEDKTVEVPEGGKKSLDGKPDPKLKASQERYFKRYGRDAFIKRFGEEGLQNLPKNMQRTALQKLGRNSKAFGIKASQKLLGKGATKVLGKIPIVGPVIDFAIRTLIFGEPLGKAAAAAVGAGIGQGIGGAIGTAGAAALAGGTFGVGLAAAPVIIGASSLIGGFLGDYIGSKLYDWISPFLTPQLATGGIVTKPTRAIIGEKGPEAVIPLNKLTGTGAASTIVGALQSAISRMGAAGTIAKALIGQDLSEAENLFGTSKVSGGDTLSKSVAKQPKNLMVEIDAGNDISILLGNRSVIIQDKKNPTNDPTTLRGQLANILGALIWVSKKNISGGGSSPGGGGGGKSSGDTSGDFTGSANAEKAFNYLKSKGLTPEQAAGLVGNFMQEAGVNIDPKITNSIGHKGIAQWDPRDRWPKLVNFAKGKNLNPETLEAQLQFVWHELDTGDGGLSLRTLKSAKTVQQAAHLFVKNYERSGEQPGHPGYDNRIKYGNQVYSKYAKMAQGGELKKSSSYMSRERRTVIDPQLAKAKQLDKFAAGGSHRVIPDTPSTSWAAGIPLTYVTSSNGKKAEVAVPLAKRFQGFIKELEATGYKINELGGFRPDGPPAGNVDGKGPQYAHPYGAAIDINWTKNPAFVGKRFGDFPRNSGEIASKYGLGWGSKFDDAMHFSALKREYGAGIDGKEITGKSLGGSKEGADYKPGSIAGSPSSSSPSETEQPESLDSLMSKLKSAVSGLNQTLGYTPPTQESTANPKPTKASPKATSSASSTGSQISKSSEDISRLEEAAKDVSNYGQIIPLPINSGTTQIAYSGTEVYAPRTPITYGI